jgi:hypothetical protein
MQTNAKPIVSAITPDASTVGCRIAVTGANLQFTTATVGGVECAVEYRSPISIIIVVAADARSGPVVVRNDTGVADNAPKFTVTFEPVELPQPTAQQPATLRGVPALPANAPPGSVLKSDGSVIAPDGSVFRGPTPVVSGVALPAGATRNADGTVTLANGMVVPGTPTPGAAGPLPALPVGAVRNADGSVTLADGTRRNADGSTLLADGVVIPAQPLPAGATRNLDGSVTLADGTRVP